MLKMEITWFEDCHPKCKLSTPIEVILPKREKNRIADQHELGSNKASRAT